MNPLSHKLRLAVLILFGIIFVVGTPILIGYSKGYRLDDALSLIATGGVYVHSDMPNTDVFLDGEFVERNGPFLRNTFIQDLEPNKRYGLWIEREGYHSWSKELLVQPNLVTEARVMMLPMVYVWSTTTRTTLMPVRTATGTATTTVKNPEYEELAEYFAEARDQFAVEVATTTTILIKGKLVATTTSTLEVKFPTWLALIASSTGFADEEMVREREGVAAWLRDGDVYATWVRPGDQPPFWFCEEKCARYLIIDWEEPILRYEFFPNRNDIVVLGSSRGIYAVELDERSTRNIQPIRVGQGLTFRLDGDSIIVFDGKDYYETRL